MSDEWFTEHVFQIVADRKNIDKNLVDLFENGTPSVLPRWVSPSQRRNLCAFIKLTSNSLCCSRRIRWELSLKHLSTEPSLVPLLIVLCLSYICNSFLFCRTPLFSSSCSCNPSNSRNQLSSSLSNPHRPNASFPFVIAPFDEHVSRVSSL